MSLARALYGSRVAVARHPPVAPKPKDPPEPTSMVGQASQFLGYFRWLFMPLGMFALIAIGVHAAADTVDDRIRFLVEQGDAWADTVFGHFEVLHRYVDAVGAEERTVIARGTTLVWELLVDIFIALPALGYAEKEAPKVQLQHLKAARTWRDMVRDVVKKPSTMRIVRPVATFALVLAGACAVGRMVQGGAFLTLRHPLTDGMAGSLARLLAVGAICGVLYSFGARAVLRNLQHADEVAAEDDKKHKTKALRFSRGLVGTMLAVPLAVAALLDATPLLAFFR